jgi:hypothetical protein
MRFCVVILNPVEGSEPDARTARKLLLSEQRPFPCPLHLNTYLHHLQLSGSCSYFTTNGKQTVYKP